MWNPLTLHRRPRPNITFPNSTTNAPFHSKPPTMRTLGWITAGLLLLVGALFVAVPIIANNRLDKLIEQANQDGNSLSIAQRDLSYRLTSFNLQLDSLNFEQDRGGQQVSGFIERIDVEGLKLLPLLSKKVRLNDLIVTRPALEVRPGTAKKDTSSNSKGTLDLRIRDLVLAEANINRYGNDGEVKQQLFGLGARLTNASFPLDTTRLPPAELQLDSLSFPRPDADWIVTDVIANSLTGELSVGRAQLSPRQGKRNYLTSQSTRSTWLALRVDDVVINELPFDTLAFGNSAVIPQLTVGDFNLEAYENPDLPAAVDEDQKPFPVELLRRLPRPVLFQRLDLKRANITYGMVSSSAGPAKITFESGSATATNMSTYPQSDSAVVNANFSLHGRSPLEATFLFDQSGNGRHWQGRGALADYDLTSCNDLLKVADGNLRIGSGYTNSLHYNIIADGGDQTRGDVRFLYENLDVDFAGSFFKNLAAGVAVRNTNPRPNGDIEIGQVAYTHDGARSFFSFYWQSIVTGLRSSAVGNFFNEEKLKSSEQVPE